jgi:hypothetical protein
MTKAHEITLERWRKELDLAKLLRVYAGGLIHGDLPLHVKLNDAGDVLNEIMHTYPELACQKSHEETADQQ